jgi:hypothetical protein
MPGFGRRPCALVPGTHNTTVASAAQTAAAVVDLVPMDPLLLNLVQ